MITITAANLAPKMKDQQARTGNQKAAHRWSVGEFHWQNQDGGCPRLEGQDAG